MTLSRTEPHDDCLTTDDLLLERVSDLIDCALRRQLWLMFLDEEERQIPVLMPAYVPRRPEGERAAMTGEFLRATFDEVGAASLVVVLERRGRAAVTASDREWLRLVHDACLTEEIPLRGPLLAHTKGVRWVAAEDFLVE